MIRGYEPELVFNNLQTIIDRVKARHPKVKLLLLGMELPAWIRDARADAFRNVYRDLAGNNHMAFVPFLLEGVAGIRRLNMADGIHPLAEGYRIVASLIWPVLKDLLEADGRERQSDLRTEEQAAGWHE